MLHCLTQFLQGSVTADLREGGSFNSSLFSSCFLNLRAKNCENWSTFDEVIIKNKNGLLLLTHGIIGLWYSG